MVLEAPAIADLNLLLEFLAEQDVAQLTGPELERACGSAEVDLIVLLANAVLTTAERTFEAVLARRAEDLVISGGVGHSTPFLRAAIKRHPRYCALPVDHLSEAEMIASIAVRHWGIDARRVWVESRSTNCAENARFTRDLLHGMSRQPVRVVVVQDPTMQRRSMATFKRVFEGDPRPAFLSCPTVVPRLAWSGDRVVYSGASEAELWPIERLVTLVMGEIPRLRDDAAGYGPKGRGYIAHVDIPTHVEEAWARLASNQVTAALIRRMP
ncbi:MAG TPA: YdcF family protein [Anaeromyxobacter sp.]|nr:YdcF family protein [Anaeromyxobacter sp.]